MTQTLVRPATAGALLRYRVMAYAVGVGLVLLVASLPYKYIGHHDEPTGAIGFVHGIIYMVLLVTVLNLAFRRRFPLVWVAVVAVAGTVPFLSFVAERQVTARVRDGRL